MTAMTGKKNKSPLRVFIMVSLVGLANSLNYQSALGNLVANILERQLAKSAASKYFNVGHVRKRPWRLRKVIKLFVGFKTELTPQQPEQVAEKHHDGNLAAGRIQSVTILR